MRCLLILKGNLPSSSFQRLKSRFYHASTSSQGWMQTEGFGIGIPFPKAKLSLIPKVHQKSIREMIASKCLTYDKERDYNRIELPIIPCLVYDDFTSVFDCSWTCSDDMRILVVSPVIAQETSGLLLNTVHGPLSEEYFKYDQPVYAALAQNLHHDVEVCHSFLQKQLQIDTSQPISEFYGSDYSNFLLNEDFEKRLGGKVRLKDVIGIYNFGIDGFIDAMK